MNSYEFIIGVFTLRIDALMLLFSQQNVSFFSFKSVIFIIHHVTRGANGSGWSLCAYIDFRTLWVTDSVIQKTPKPQFSLGGDSYKLESVKKGSADAQDQKYFVKKKGLHISELFIAVLLNVRRLRGENIYWFTSAGFALRLQALN